ncbi:MAG: F0F1 ATP synthase subunit A, partial [Candidatus Brocadiales bacterium]
METGIKELPTFLDFFLDMHQHLFGLTLHQWMPVIMSMLIIVCLVSFCHLYTRRLQRVPGAVQAFLEIVVEFLDDFAKANMGRVGEAFVPLIGTLFIYIWIMNMLGQIPLFHSPTANYNTTLALTLIVFFLTHYHGLKNN